MATDHGSVQWYLNEIGKHALLTPAEEITLGNRIQAWVQLRGQNIPEDQLTDDQRRIRRRGRDAFVRMYEANLRLVVSVARKYLHAATHLSLSDLIQSGNIGMARAIELFDPSKGYKFSTYAYWWIRQALSRGLSAEEKTIRLPQSAVLALKKIRERTPVFRAQYGRLPTVAEMAEWTGSTQSAVKNYLKHSVPCASLDQATIATADRNEPTNLIDLVAHDALTPEEQIWSQEVTVGVIGTLKTLGELEYRLMCMKHGLDGHSIHTGAEICRQLGLSKSELMRIERRCKTQLRLKLGHMRNVG